MSQGSNSSEESLALSEGTFGELKDLVGPDVKYITETDNGIDQHQDHRLYDSQPSCSYVDPALLQDSGESSSGGFYHSHSSNLPCTYTMQPDTFPRYQPIVPKTAVNQVPSPSAPMPSLQPGIPLDQDFPGPFNFELEFEPQREPAPKASSWIYSYKLNKLFAKRKANIPVRITLKVPPTQDIMQFLTIRIGMVYSNIEHSQIIVKRCPNHSSNPERSSQHIMEVTNREAVYETNQQTGQHELTIPFKILETGHNYKLEFISFMCLNTCPGGPDRRPFHAVFTLLLQDEVVGVKILKTKICSTPGRTRDDEEKMVGMPRRVRTSGSKGPVPKKRVKTKVPELPVETGSTHESDMSSINQAVPGMFAADGDSIHIKREDDDDEIFTIQVRGREKYEYLMRIKEAIELMPMIPPEIVQSYRASCLPCGPNWFLQQSNQSSTVPASQPFTPNNTTTSTANQSSPSAQSNTRYTLKNVLIKKRKAGSAENLLQELQEAAK